MLNKFSSRYIYFHLFSGIEKVVFPMYLTRVTGTGSIWKKEGKLDFDFKMGWNPFCVRHVASGEAGGQMPPQILADQKAPPDSGGAQHYYSPPQIFKPCNMPVEGDNFKFQNK